MRATRITKTAILVVTNGERTEKEYLDWLKTKAKTNDMSVKVLFIPGEPKTLIRKLKASDNSGYNEVWIVVDKDGKDRSDFVSKCKNRRSAQKWYAIISRPCFEVWLIAHYERVKNYQDQNDAETHYNKLASARDNVKCLPKDFPYENLGEAIKRCHLVGYTPAELGEMPISPGTAMVHLVERLKIST